MEKLISYLSSEHSSVEINFHNKEWHVDAGITNKPGWYYISTNTPIDVLQRLPIWAKTYTRVKDKQLADVRNYDIKKRAARFSEAYAQYFNIKDVYSGYAANLASRAREHTFPDPGTGGLALSKYLDLYKYDWVFNYITLDGFITNCECEEVILRLGEQTWRAKNGWPILCVE